MAAGFAAACAVAGLASSASANGKFPAAGQLVVDPSDPAHIVVRTTFGVVTTRDAGTAWDWICEEAAGYSNYEPPIAVTGNGSVLAGLSTGVSVAAGGTCAWSASLGIGPLFVPDGRWRVSTRRSSSRSRPKAAPT